MCNDLIKLMSHSLTVCTSCIFVKTITLSEEMLRTGPGGYHSCKSYLFILKQELLFIAQNDCIRVRGPHHDLLYSYKSHRHILNCMDLFLTLTFSDTVMCIMPALAEA